MISILFGKKINIFIFTCNKQRMPNLLISNAASVSIPIIAYLSLRISFNISFAFDSSVITGHAFYSYFSSDFFWFLFSIPKTII